MSARPYPRLVPRDEDRATWCLRCERLARIGVSPLLPVESCHRCAWPELPAWRVRLGPWVLVLAALLFLALSFWSEPLVHPGESAFPRPAETR